MPEGGITLTQCGPPFDLKTTLPTAAPLGGTFRVRTDLGPDLPSGVVLDPLTGLVTATCGMMPVSVNGVVFDYESN